MESPRGRRVSAAIRLRRAGFWPVAHCSLKRALQSESVPAPDRLDSRERARCMSGPVLALAIGAGTRRRGMQEERVRGISSVLCAVDIAEPGRAAFGQALALARAHDARLLTVHGVPLDRSFNTGATERVTYLRGMSMAAQAAGVDVRVSVQSGEAAEIILLHARARESGLIVLSAQHGKANGRAAGSVAEDVLRGAGCPTLIVPLRAAGPPLRAFDNALCAVDLSADLEGLVERVASLVQQREHRLVLFHAVAGSTSGSAVSRQTVAKDYVRGLGKDALRRLQDLIPAERGGAVFARVSVGDVVPEIVEAARASRADMIVIAARRRTRLGRRMFGITAQLLRQADRPVLAVPAPAAALRDRDSSRKAA